MATRGLLALVLSLQILTGCGGMRPEQFAGTEPELVIEEYFLGRTRGWGIFEDRFGDLRRQFVVDIRGAWQGSEFVMVEDFVYADGETEQRTWRIRKLPDGRYQGTAGDIIGIATGQAAGNALNWRYALDLKVGDSTWEVNFDDWMFLQPDGVLMNRARVTKWGFEIGEVTLVFHRWPLMERASAGVPDHATSAPRAVAE